MVESLQESVSCRECGHLKSIQTPTRFEKELEFDLTDQLNYKLNKLVNEIHCFNGRLKINGKSRKERTGWTVIKIRLTQYSKSGTGSAT